MFIDENHVMITMSISLFLLIPGPTNTLIFCSGYKQGIIKCIPLILAEWSGYLIAVTVWGLLFKYLSQHGNLLLSVIKFLSSIYVAYMAIKVWRFSVHHIRGCITFGMVFTTTLLNPKAFVFSDSFIPSSAFIYQQNYLYAMICLLMALFPTSFIWVYSGSFISKRGSAEQQGLNPVFFYRGASLIISFFAVSMFYKSASVIFE